ncbi:hypothetical protein Tco_0074330 [Tanacetum coccineum]
MHESVKTDVQLQSDILIDEAQAKNEDFINKLDDRIKKIIKDQVLTRSSIESNTSHVVAANLSELELKNIIIDKMESNKSIHISDEQKNLYKTLVDAYESDKLILDTYGDTISFKRRSKPHHKSAQAEEPMHTTEDLEEPAHQEFVTGDTEDKLDEKTSQLPDWFQKPAKPPTPDHDWNKTFPAAHGHVQP